MNFADIHMHGLYGVDDGAASEGEMHAIVDASYADGTRLICMTPHFHPGYYGDNHQRSAEVFRKLCDYAAQKYPDLKLMLGNELHYSKDCVSWLSGGVCRTLNRTRHVLVDFAFDEKATNIIKGVERLLNAGFVPVLAHAERYSSLECDHIRTMRENGVKIQINSGSMFRLFGVRTQKRMKAILADRLADFVSSDAHGVMHRPPVVSKCYQYITKAYGADYADALCYKNALNVLCQKESGEK